MALGERGPVWWTDGAPDLNRQMARNTALAVELERVGQRVLEVGGIGWC